MQSFGGLLLDGVDAAGNGASVEWNGGRGVLSAAGTFGGTSVTLEYMGPDAATWLPVRVMASDGVQTTVALTAAGMFGFELPPGRIRGAATGGTPTDLFVRADRVLY